MPGALFGRARHRNREAAEHPYPKNLWFVVCHRRLHLAAMLAMVLDRHYPPAKQGHRAGSTSFSTVVEIFTLVGILFPGRVESREPACFR